jgi:hypothetical protein
VQYDVARLQYLRLHIDELRHERARPFTHIEGLVALLVVLVTAVLADTGLATLLHYGLGRLP